MILDAIDEAGISESTDVVVMSDHGQIGITRVISPNVWLVDKGYIRLAEDGGVESFDAYVQSTGASAHVYLSRPDDAALYEEVYALLRQMADGGIYGFERVYTDREAKEKYGLFGDFSFVLETDGYTSFGERLKRPAVSGFDPGDYRTGKATHGHEPHKGPQPPFIGKGPSFRKDVRIPTGDILNHAPTMAAVLGIELRDAWGKAVSEILSD
jgi:predicted AlkP superfamily pyrophosphatase or phosphodiesterase